MIGGKELVEASEAAATIPIAEPVMEHILSIVMATHDKQNKYIREGASPRAAQALVRGSRAKAFMEGRYNVSFEDVNARAFPVLRHRIILSFDAISDGITEDKLIDTIIRGIH